jgi:hypothetical protein
MGLVQGELGGPEAPGQRDRAERRPGGMSFAIPIDDIVPFLDDVAKFGRVRHGLFGVSTRGAFVNGAGAGERIPIGAVVEAVQPGGPAAKLGLRGDLIVAFNGERVGTGAARALGRGGGAGSGRVAGVGARRAQARGRTSSRRRRARSERMNVDTSSSISAGEGPGGLAVDIAFRRPSRALTERSQAADTTAR